MDPRESGIFPRFYLFSKEDQAATLREGRPMFRDVEQVEIVIAGDKSTVLHQKVNDQHKQRWAAQYAAFKANQVQSVEGTPIEQWPLMTPAKVAELKSLKIFTVESLANLADAKIEVLGMGGRDLQSQAKAYLAKAKDTALEQKLAKENEGLRRDIEMLKQQIAALGEAPKRRRGRPRKDAA